MPDWGAVVDKLVQAGDIDKGRVRSGKVKIGEQAERRMPGDRFAVHPVPWLGSAGLIRPVQRRVLECG